MSLSAAIAEPVTRIQHRMPHAPFPPEFLGKARQWRERFAPTDRAANDIFDAILLPLIERARRHPVPRPDMLAEAARTYRQRMPEAGRLDLRIEHRKTRLAISDTRISVSDFQRQHWQNAEPGIALLRLEIALAPRSIRADLAYIACVSLHALARRLQRAFSISECAILDDLRALVAAHDVHRHIGAEFLVTVTDGAWAGIVAEVASRKGRSHRILNTRTFLPAENDDE